MHLGIDATNIHQGGGVTLLVQLLSAASPQQHDISKITVWCSPKITKLFPKRSWLNIRSNNWLKGGRSLKRFFFQHLFLSLEMRSLGCDIAFFPGSTLPLISLLPAVTISQNMLPFELDKSALFGRFSLMYLKFCILRILQSISFKRAVGIIFLSQYAQIVINNAVAIKGLQILIPHGINENFFRSPRQQYAIEYYSTKKPFRFLYVSILMPYKHQMEVIEAIYQLRKEGYPVTCDFIGPSWGSYGRKVLHLLSKLDPEHIFLSYLGEVPYRLLPSYYHNYEAFIFASSCENLPNILIEAMASGVPIASSKRGPMPDILNPAGFYFDPELPKSISDELKKMILMPHQRSNLASLEFKSAEKYSWELCAKETWKFFAGFKDVI